MGQSGNIKRLFFAGFGVCVTASLCDASAAGLNRDGARECYLATLRVTSPETDQAGLQACGQALDAAVDPDMRAGLLANRAYIRLRMADYPGTIADATAALALEPDLAAANLNQGAGLIGMGQFRNALPFLEKAVALSNGNKLELAYYNRGIVREHIGDVPGAYFDYKKAAELDPKFAPAQEQLSRFSVTTSPGPNIR